MDPAARWLLCARGVETVGLRKARRCGTGEGMAATCQCPSSRLAAGGGSASASWVVSLGHERGWRKRGAGGSDRRNTRLGGCVGCRHTLSAALAVHGASLFPLPCWGAVPHRQHMAASQARRLLRAGHCSRREPAAGAACSGSAGGQWHVPVPEAMSGRAVVLRAQMAGRVSAPRRRGSGVRSRRVCPDSCGVSLQRKEQRRGCEALGRFGSQRVSRGKDALEQSPATLSSPLLLSSGCDNPAVEDKAMRGRVFALHRGDDALWHMRDAGIPKKQRRELRARKCPASGEVACMG